MEELEPLPPPAEPFLPPAAAEPLPAAAAEELAAETAATAVKATRTDRNCIVRLCVVSREERERKPADVALFKVYRVRKFAIMSRITGKKEKAVGPAHGPKKTLHARLTIAETCGG